jgi:hypothetical protein
MISLQDSIKYIAMAIILYCLLKAFCPDLTMKDQELACLVISIVFVVFILTYQNGKCNKKEKKDIETYQMTAPPLVDSIYPEKLNIDEKPDIEIPYRNIEYADDDIKDFKDIMAIDKKTFKKLMENEQKAMKRVQDRHTNEMVYTTTHPFNTVPLGTQLYGYTYLPPENWFRAYERPPVCVTDQRCPVCPSGYNGTADLMQFDTSNNVVNASGIDLRYIKKVLNKDH